MNLSIRRSYDRAKEQGAAYSRKVRSNSEGEGSAPDTNGGTGEAKDLDNNSSGKDPNIR